MLHPNRRTLKRTSSSRGELFVFMCVKNNMRHDDRYSMENKRYAHVMAQHGISEML